MKRFCHSVTCPEHVTLRETKGLKGRSEESFLYNLNRQSKGGKSKMAVQTVCRTLSGPEIPSGGTNGSQIIQCKKKRSGLHARPFCLASSHVLRQVFEEVAVRDFLKMRQALRQTTLSCAAACHGMHTLISLRICLNFIDETTSKYKRLNEKMLRQILRVAQDDIPQNDKMRLAKRCFGRSFALLRMTCLRMTPTCHSEEVKNLFCQPQDYIGRRA